MAALGLRYLIASKLTETETEATYTDGLILSNAIKADVSIEINDAQLFADDKIVESIKEFRSGKLSLEGDHLSYEALSLILGHEILDMENGQKLVARGEDEGNFVGVGFYAPTIKNNIKRYRAIWLTKVKFGIPNENLETKGDSIKFQTPKLEGAVMTDITGRWKEEATFNTEVQAKSWLDEMANMKSMVASVIASPAGGIFTEEQEVILTTKTAGAIIKYTTDGSIPTSTNGTAFTDPVEIIATTVLKTRAFKDGLNNSVVGTETYIINI